MQTEVTKTKKIAVKPETTTALKVSEEFVSGGWSEEVIDTTDLIIPNILLMHGMSDLVKKGERNQGEIIKSTTNEVLAKRGDTLDFIVFDKWKEWRIMKKNPQSGRFEYVRTEEWTKENNDLPWDFSENGETFRRDKTLNFYGILPKEIESGQIFPVKISFSRTSFKSGMKLADAYTKSVMMGQPPIRQVFKIGTELVTGNSETYFVFTVTPGTNSTPEQQKTAMQWRQMVLQAKRKKLIVDHEVEETPVETAVHATEF